MVTTIPEIDLFSRALRRATRDVEAFQQTLARTPAASARAALTAEPEEASLQAAVYRPPAGPGQAMPQGEGAEVVPARGGGVGIILGLAARLKKLYDAFNALKKVYEIANPLAQAAMPLQSELEKLQNQIGASATEIEAFRQKTLAQSQTLLQTPETLTSIFSKVATLDLDKAAVDKTDDKGDTALRKNTKIVSDTIAKTAYVRNISAIDLTETVTPLLRPVQENMNEVRVRLAQIYTVFGDAPLPEALMKSSFAPVVNRVEQFGVTQAESIGSATSLLEIAKLRASDPAQAVKATEELFAQLNDADVRAKFKENGVDITALRQQAIASKQDPLDLIAEAIQKGKFNQNDLDFEMKSIMKEKQSAVLLSDLVRKQKEYAAGKKAVTEESDPQNLTNAFKARQDSALGVYRAGGLGIDNAKLRFGTLPMELIGRVKGPLGQLGQITEEDIKNGGKAFFDKINPILKELQEGIEGSGFGPDFQFPTEWPGRLVPSSTVLPLPKGENLPTLQQAAYSQSSLIPQTAAPAALPAKAELTIHFTGLPSGVQAQVMSETEWFNIQTSMGYNCHSRGGLPPVPRSLRGRF